jgi:branched-chain amino acid aminotransferase
MTDRREDKSYVWFDDGIVESDLALISAFSPSARYGLSIFEGVRGYLRQDSSGINVYRLDDHIVRLFRSAERLSLPIQSSPLQIKEAINETILANQIKSDCYIRVDVLSTQSGSWHSLEPGTLTITAANSVKEENLDSRALNAAFTNWKRIDESQMPPSIKAGANYINSRYGYLDVKNAGYDVPIFINLEGFISESSGACIMAVIDGELTTPPITAQILHSITRDSLISLSQQLGILAKERNIHPQELENASEIFLCGTAVEIAPIISLSGKKIGTGNPGEITRLLFKGYLKDVRAISDSSQKENSMFLEIGNDIN